LNREETQENDNTSTKSSATHDDDDNDNKQWTMANRCYTIVATAPILQLHTRALLALVERERLYAIDALNRRMTSDERRRVRREARHYIASYRRVVLPSPGQSVYMLLLLLFG
jgi:hypothetical protein